MKIKLYLDVCPICEYEDFLDFDIFCEEFCLNWNNQVPHWDFLTNEGISFFKGEKFNLWKEINSQ